MRSRSRVQAGQIRTARTTTSRNEGAAVRARSAAASRRWLSVIAGNAREEQARNSAKRAQLRAPPWVRKRRRVAVALVGQQEAHSSRVENRTPAVVSVG